MINLELPQSCANCVHLEELRLALLKYQLDLTKENLDTLLETIEKYVVKHSPKA